MKPDRESRDEEETAVDDHILAKKHGAEEGDSLKARDLERLKFIHHGSNTHEPEEISRHAHAEEPQACPADNLVCTEGDREKR